MEYINVLNPLDDRYKDQISGLSDIFSEKSFFKYRAKVELKYLYDITSLVEIKFKNNTPGNRKKIFKIAEISDSDFFIIKKIEKEGYKNIKATNHDVKALEYFIQLKLKELRLHEFIPYVHFALTSEDTNNIAYSLMLRDAMEKELIPLICNISDTLKDLAKKYRDLPILARTHGQPASPTTFGKEFKVFQSRLERKVKKIKDTKIEAKLNGATGNYNAHKIAYPEIDWITFSKKFINSFNKDDNEIQLSPNLITTQIEPRDSYAEIFDLFKQVNCILLDMSQDLWRYISDNWLILKPVEGEIGSSTMPHKVNPIDFENAEGNLGIANSLLNYLSMKLPISRLQRDLSDSTVLRNIGTSFGYCVVAYKSIIKGIKKIQPNEEVTKKILEDNYQVIAEAIQTIFRREGIQNAYEILMENSRDKQFTPEVLEKILKDLKINKKTKKEILSLLPSKYIGLAKEIASLK